MWARIAPQFSDLWPISAFLDDEARGRLAAATGAAAGGPPLSDGAVDAAIRNCVAVVWAKFVLRQSRPTSAQPAPKCAPDCPLYLRCATCI